MKKDIIRNIFRSSLLMSAAMLLNISAHATTSNTDNTFKIMTINVDGLPGKILLFNVNAEGPQMGGSIKISDYVERQACDIVCMQENFNYAEAVGALLDRGYDHDEWSGGLFMDNSTIDWLHLQNLKFPCDGLTTYWKKGISCNTPERVAWNVNFGKFSHCFDDIITKGFRRYEITIREGIDIVVYDMHMDATDDIDAENDNDTRDSLARKAQWEQLREHILANLDTRPVVVVGDMNSYYGRDNIKTIFFDAIESTERATVGDAWVEKANGGEFADDGLDKIIYINPKGGNKVTPLSCSLDKEGYKYEDKPLGDHFPVIATFAYSDDTATGIAAMETETKSTQFYDLGGRRQSTLKKGLNIIRESNGETTKLNVGK